MSIPFFISTETPVLEEESEKLCIDFPYHEYIVILRFVSFNIVLRSYFAMEKKIKKEKLIKRLLPIGRGGGYVGPP